MTLPLVEWLLWGAGTIFPTGIEIEASRRIFGSAALLLAGERVADETAHAVLSELNYATGTGEISRHRLKLLSAAGRFRRVFSVHAPEARNLLVIGAEVDPAAFGLGDGPVGYVAGTGFSLQEAFEACVGEGVEYASQFPAPADRFSLLTEDEALAGSTPAWHEVWARLKPYRRQDSHNRAAWAQAASLVDGEPVYVPADLCFRRSREMRDVDAPWALSTGTGAGVDLLDAVLHGLLELIERDAVALWWRGGNPPRIVSGGAGSETLERLRGGPTHRRSWLMDISTDVGVPVVVAASCNDSGFGLCCGFAARMTIEKAADAAIREMLQMELAHHLSDTKRRTRGEDSLNDLDWRHIQRFHRIDVRKTRALHPVAPPAPVYELPVSSENRVTLGFLRERLEALGLSPCVLNLTKAEIGVPAVQALCAGLEVGMTGPPGPRLRAAAAEWDVDPMAATPL